MSWNKPSQSGRGIEFMSIFEITRQPVQLFESHGKNTDELLNKLIGYQIESPLVQCRSANMFSFVNDHSSYSNNYCYRRLQEINNVSLVERSNIEEQTRGQSTSKAWLRARQSRITGSIISDVLKTVKSQRYSDKPALKNMTIKNLNFVNAIKWGQDHENMAKEEYMKITGNDINSSGIWIHHIYNFLASSPDGINFDLDLVIEIKCPYSIRNENPTNAPYLELKNSIFSLKRSHSYYAQCQLHMLVTCTDHCDFIIYTNKGIFIESIPKNKTFQMDMVNKASTYFKQVFAPTYMKYLH